jgi:hypothetical protein
MRDRAKWWVAAGACAAAAASWQDAFAGNVDVTIPASSVEYFSVKLDYATRLHIGSVVAGALIDDITYMVEPQPLAVTARTPLFTWNDVFGWEDLDGIGLTRTVLNRQEYYGNVTTGAFGHTPGILVDVQQWASAYGSWVGLEVVESSLTWAYLRPFDGVCHTFYGQMLGREVLLNDQKQGNVAAGVGMGVSVTLSQSSESRHYQTPHIIVQYPPDTRTVAVVPAVPSGAYGSVRVFVKGRVILDPLDLPRPTGHVHAGP